MGCRPDEMAQSHRFLKFLIIKAIIACALLSGAITVTDP